MTLKETIALNVLIWACVYPSVLIFSYGFQWLGIDVPLWVEIGISTAVSVPLISTLCTPRIEAAIARAEGESPADLKMRQAEEAEGPDPDAKPAPRREAPLHGTAE